MELLKEYKCEILIIGSGPAGCSAAVYCGRSSRDTIILDGKQKSALQQTREIRNYPSYGRMTGPELLEKFKEHAKQNESVRMIEGDVISLMVGMGIIMISTRTANIMADAVIIATGKGFRKEQIKGEEALIGYGVSYCALCDGPLYRDKVVVLYGNDKDVLEEALILKQMGCIVTIITEVGIDELSEKIDHQHHNIDVYDKSQIIEIVGNDKNTIQNIVFKSNNPNMPEDIKTMELDCLFILSHIPSNSIFKKAGIELDESGNIKVDNEQKTNVEGVFAAGDVTGGIYQVVFATAEGARAGLSANKYVRELKKDKQI